MKKQLLLLSDSKQSELLEKVLFDVISFNPENVLFTTMETFADDLKRVKPKAIMSVGEECLNFLGFKSILSVAGKTLQYEDLPLVPVVGTGYVERNQKYIENYAQTIMAAYNAVYNTSPAENQTVLIENMTDVWNLISYIKQVGYVSFDFETSKIDPKLKTFAPDFQLVALSMSFQQGSSYVILIDHRDASFNPASLKKVVEALDKEVFGNPNIVKIAHNAKYDMHCASRWGVKNFKGCFHDTMVMSHLLDENTSNKLKDCINTYIPKFFGYARDVEGMDWEKLSTEELVKYSSLDADLTFRLYWLFTDLLLEDEAMYRHFRNIDAPATLTLFEMEREGMLIDKAFLLSAIDKVELMIEAQKAKMMDYSQVKKFNEIREKDINLRSPMQLKDLLYTSDGFDFKPWVDWRTKEPSLSTDKKVLEYVKDKTGFLTDLVMLRQLEKIASTYLKGVLDSMTDQHRIHTTFNQHVTKTGRLSASGFNLQNVITRTKFKQVEEAVSLVKRSFIPPPGHTLMQCDFSQAELRFIAWYAEEDTMLEAYKNKQDLHALTAATIKKLSLEEFLKLTEKEIKRARFEAKAVNFGLIYLMSAKGFQSYAKVNYGLELSEKQAEDYQKLFFKKYPKLRIYHKLYIKKAEHFGYVRTFFGRRVRLPDIYSLNKRKRGEAERNAVNSPIQGSAGELTILALTILRLLLPAEVKIVNSVHDNILFYGPDNLMEETIQIVKQFVEDLPLLTYFHKTIDTVTMEIDFEESKKSWGELEKV